MVVVGGGWETGLARGTDESGLRIQRLPAVLAGALVVAKAMPEVIVIAEVGTEVVVVDGALVAASRGARARDGSHDFIALFAHVRGDGQQRCKAISKICVRKSSGR